MDKLVILSAIFALVASQNTPCPPGRFAIQTVCHLCPAGSFASDTAVRSSCTPCPEGTFAASEGSTSCATCPAGTTTSGTGATSCDVTSGCAAGTQLGTGGQCFPCPAGSFKATVGNTNCSPCAAFSYQPAQGQTSCLQCGTVTTTGSTTCPDCQPGQYVAPSVGCTPCPAGTYQPTGGQASQCLSCPTATGTGNTACTVTCQAGTYPLNGVCTPCPAGTAKATSGSEACTPCAVFFFQPNTGQTACLNCPTAATTGQTTCTDCPAGTFADYPDCEPCPVGTAQPSPGISTTCQPCSTAFTVGTTTCPQTASCQPGQYPVNNVCTNCPAGTYQPAQGGTECLQCPAGTSQASTGASQCTQCLAGTFQDQVGQPTCNTCPADFTSNPGATSCTIPVCPSGSFLSGSQCELCAEGTYQSLRGQLNCVDCSPGLTTRAPGATSSTMCVARCQPGSFETPTGCDLCDYGSYQPAAEATDCTSCPAGQTTRMQGATSASQCVDVCGPGRFLVGDECIACDVGFYQPLVEQLACIACPGQNTTRTEGAVSVTQCEFLCGLGEYQVGLTCVPCALGTYAPVIGLMRCETCPDDTTTYQTGSVLPNQCLPICDAGSVLTGSVCSVCGFGFYQPSSGQTACLACPQGMSTFQMGSVSSTDCKDVCRPGFYHDGTRCEACPVGEYQPAENQRSCLVCPVPLTTVQMGSTNRTDCQLLCEPGSYWDTNSQECRLCDEDEYQGDRGARSCNSCPAGTRALTTGATDRDQCHVLCERGHELDRSSLTCEPCQVMYYKNSVGFDPCQRCDPGFTTAGTGATSQDMCYLSCDAGYSLVGDTCVPCALAYYQDETGSRMCKQCPPNYSTRFTGSTKRSECILLCGAGEQLEAGVCKACPRGTYKNSTSLGVCASCPSGLTTSMAGAQSLAACDMGDCAPGSFVVGPSCMLCPLGTYQPDRWMTSCLNCPDRHTTTQTGSSSSTQCIFTCPPGQTVSGDTCINCPKGYYKDTEGTAQCTLCPALYTTITTGATSIDQCNVVMCTSGQFRNTLGSCEQCAKGSYQPRPEQISCINCPTGFTTYPNDNGQFAATSPQACLTTDQCALNRDNCHERAICESRGEGFTCTCQFGYQGDGVNRCAHPCDDNGFCHNSGSCVMTSTGNGYSCLCTSGYSGDRCQEVSAEEEEDDDLAIILGATLGGLAFLLLLALAIALCCWCWRANNSEKEVVETQRVTQPQYVMQQPAQQYYQSVPGSQTSSVYFPQQSAQPVTYSVKPF